MSSSIVRLFCVLGFVAAFGVRLSQQAAGDRPAAPPRPAPPPAAAPVSPPRDEIVLHYSADRVITVNGETVPLDALRTRLRSLYRTRADRTLWVDGDGSLKYGEIAAVIDAARDAGVGRVGVITPEMRRGK